MKKNIFLNLPVKDLEKAKTFFASLGFSFNAQFTDENAACMVIEENIFVMLLMEKFFQRFTTKTIADSHDTTEAITALSLDSREAVDVMYNAAIAAGAKFNREPDDHGWMYSRSFQDLDGHIWEIMYADQSAINA